MEMSARPTRAPCDASLLTGRVAERPRRVLLFVWIFLSAIFCPSYLNPVPSSTPCLRVAWFSLSLCLSGMRVHFRASLQG